MAAVASIPSDPRALRLLIEERLKDSHAAADHSSAHPGAFSSQVDAAMLAYFPPAPVAAAVLVPIVDHADGLTVLLTQRAAHLKNHAGQISFPGGRIEPSDASPVEAALREAEEEIGLPREFVRCIGYLAPHLVLTGFWVTPVVGIVRPGFELKIDPREVDSAIEVPLTHILDAANHRERLRTFAGQSVTVHDIPYGDHNIWGATAGMLMGLYRTLARGDGSHEVTK